MIILSHKFRPPKKTDDKKWETVKYLIENGFYYEHVYPKDETNSKGIKSYITYVKYPENISDAKEFVEKYKKQALKIMKVIISFIIILSSINTFGQSDTSVCTIDYLDFYVGHTPGIDFKSQPTQESESICFLPFGTKVKICSHCLITDSTVDNKHWSNFEGEKCWKAAKYNDILGYIFSGYLTEMTIITDQNLCLLKEGPICPENLSYNPDLYWYGIYSEHLPKKLSSAESRVSKLKSVKVNITTFKEDCYGAGTPTVCIYTDVEEESLFLFGISQKLSDTTLKVHRRYGEQFIGFIYPGQYISTVGGYILQGRGVVTHYSEKRDEPFDFYEVALINENHPSISQIISKDFFNDYKPSIVWDGDLNADNLPDFLFNDFGRYFLLLSSNKHEKNKLIEKFATFKLWNCN
jgi:hypothetical protein